ncbi:MAG: TonB-dependent receptor [Proteiniphilum sp.]|nr:TonB-dependent receptor [Proteiniphilum sp.]
MLKKTILIFANLFAVIMSVFGQQNLIGIVKDSISGKPVADVYIMLMRDDGSNILAYSYSQESGVFSIEFPDTEQQHFLLTTSRLGYAPWQKKVSRQTQKLEIKLQETSTPLREVRITSPPIKQRGDTIDYYMSGFVRPQDRTLADVLARMPGIEVQTDGRVQYEGKPINRFYIENMNLLEQRYSIATKNLSPDDISTVQVYENHEPVKMLRDRSDSEQAALNIKLKEDAKAKWLHTFDFGVGGLPFLYDANTSLVRFARGNQSMLIGKTNNTGKDIFLELKMHTLKPGVVFRPGFPDGIPDQLSILSVESSFFTRDRARFNESAITSLNQLWRVAKDTDMRFNTNYGFEREKRERSIETEYRFENQPAIVIKDYTSQTVNWHKLENELAFTANKSDYYLEEKLNANIHWKEALADIETNNHAIRQNLDLPRMHVKNNTSFSKLIRDISIGAGNNTEFTRLPQSLVLTAPEEMPLFTENYIHQTVQYNDGFSDTYITLNYKKRNHSIDIKTGAEWVWQAIESELNPLPEMQDNFHNSLTWKTARFYAEPSHRLNYRLWTFTSSVSANYMQTYYSGEKENYVYFNPRFRVIYEPSGNIRFNAGYAYNLRYGDLNQMKTGYVLKRYNLFSKGIEELQRTAAQNLNWGVFYKNISHFFNLHYLGIYSYYRNNLVPANFIREYYNFTWWEYKEKPSTFLVNRLSATKLFTDISLTAGLSLSYNQNRSTMEQQGASIQYINHSFGMSPSLKWNAKKNLNFDYTMDAFFSGVSMNEDPVGNYIPLINHQLYTFWEITGELSLTSALQHYYNKAPGSSVTNLWFADLGVQYIFNKVTVSLYWTNIFNQKQHITSSYNAVNTITRVDKLRPGEVLVSLRFKR